MGIVTLKCQDPLGVLFGAVAPSETEAVAVITRHTPAMCLQALSMGKVGHGSAAAAAATAVQLLLARAQPSRNLSQCARECGLPLGAALAAAGWLCSQGLAKRLRTPISAQSRLVVGRCGPCSRSAAVGQLGNETSPPM